MRPILFYLISIVIVIADQVTKWAVIQSLPLNARQPVIGNFLALTHTRNTGGEFSLFPAGNSSFVVVAIIALGALIFAYHRFQRSNLLVSSALGLALGGAIGNLIDRIQYGYVVDFFDVAAGKYHWPVFNIADSAITVGILLLAGHFLFSKEGTGTKETDQGTATKGVVSNPSSAKPDNLVADE